MVARFCCNRNHNEIRVTIIVCASYFKYKPRGDMFRRVVLDLLLQFSPSLLDGTFGSLLVLFFIAVEHCHQTIPRRSTVESDVTKILIYVRRPGRVIDTPSLGVPW